MELFGQYTVARDNMTSSNKKERRLWHGTSVDVVQNINKGGFNRSYCGKNGKSLMRSLFILLFNTVKLLLNYIKLVVNLICIRNRHI